MKVALHYTLQLSADFFSIIHSYARIISSKIKSTLRMAIAKVNIRANILAGRREGGREGGSEGGREGGGPSYGNFISNKMVQSQTKVSNLEQWKGHSLSR